ncbi:unnamed protein product [marine sediment metagenome]|uniref:Uncharacterized protein n=1 Tax=marine sediment metagenome TaxID=412755 RepID=X0WUB7_9ZZZZ
MAFVEALNLRYWLINTLSGSIEIFSFLAMIIIAGLAARFRMNGFLTVLMLGLFAVMLSQYMAGIYILVILITSLIVFVGISRFTKT